MFFWAAAPFLGAAFVCAQGLPAAPYLPAQDTPHTQNAPVTVQFPQENMTVAAGAKSVYLFGKLRLKNAELEINGQNVPVHENGAFIAYLPVEQGEFSFVLTARTENGVYQAVRRITVPGEPIKNFEQKARFDSEEIYPSSPVWALPGDVLNLFARGTPGAEVKAELHGLKGGKNIPMKEDLRTPGMYRAKYLVREDEKPRTAKVTYRLRDSKTKTKADVSAKERVKILNPEEPLPPAAIQEPGVKLRQMAVRQGSLYPYYRAFGETLVNGRDNGLYRLQLAEGENAWLEERKLKLLPPSSYQNNALFSLSALAEEPRTVIRWRGRKQVPVSVHEFNNRLEVAFYHTPVFEENFSIDATSPVLDRTEWTQEPNGVVRFILYLKNARQLWGHAYRYEGNDFILELKHQPQITPSKDKPLAGARILLDAGHSPRRKPPYDGLVSPCGVLEYEANLALAEALKPKLEAAGASVIMTRQGQNHMTLPERYAAALQNNAHIFISLHHNALPETANPMAAPRGYSVYYTYPHSFPLAESIYQSFNKRVPLPDNGLIANDVLFIPRIPEMPSVLVENAYMILPEQEELVMSAKGRETFADALYRGILHFYGADEPAAPKHAKKQNKKR